MLAIHDYVSKATRDRVAWHLDAGTTLGETMVNGLRRYADLNLNLARATLEQGNVAARQLLSAQDARQFLARAAAQVQPNALRSFDYGYYLSTIAADTQANVIRVLGDSVAETNREWIEIAGDVGESGPFGWKSAMLCLKDLAGNASRIHADLIRAIQSALRMDAPLRHRASVRIESPS